MGQQLRYAVKDLLDTRFNTYIDLEKLAHLRLNKKFIVQLRADCIVIGPQDIEVPAQPIQTEATQLECPSPSTKDLHTLFDLVNRGVIVGSIRIERMPNIDLSDYMEVAVVRHDDGSATIL
jgi:hypothetical protein